MMPGTGISELNLPRQQANLDRTGNNEIRLPKKEELPKCIDPIKWMQF